MRLNFKILFSSLVLLVLVNLSCKTPVYRHPEAVFPRLQIGEGGGFTGALALYQVLPNGQIFYRDMGDTTFQEVNRMKKKEAKKLLDLTLKSLNGGETVLEPDNIYRTISYIYPDTIYTATWYRNRSELDEVYNQILSKIMEQNVVK